MFFRIVVALLAGFSSQLLADDFFEKQVRPLLVKRCFACHSGTKTSGGLSLETRQGWVKGGESGPAIVPGKPAESLLVSAINYDSLQMPPKNKGGRLPQSEIDILIRWIRSGAHDPRTEAVTKDRMSAEQAAQWWSFQPLPTPNRELDAESIDRMVNRTLQSRGLRPVDTADRRTLIRRAAYDLTGLPPTAEEVDAFVKDQSAQAWQKVIERLLASDQYGVRWGRHWLDVVRYADTAGENSDRPLPHAWRYRNWVIDSFNRDMSFREFVQLQLAGDILGGDTVRQRQDGIIATGYLAVARRYGHDIDKDIHLMHEDVIDNLGKSMLGLTIGCARCHDHKYDPVTSEDYYALYGIFSSTLFSFPGCEPKGQPRDLIPLPADEVMQSIFNKYEREKAEFDARQTQLVEATQELDRLQEGVAVELTRSEVLDGQTVPFSMDNVKVKRGEVLQLVVAPGESHGADTTSLEWTIQDSSTGTLWNIRDLIQTLLRQGPVVQDKGAAWCFVETTGQTRFLPTAADNLGGHYELVAWTSVDALPYVGANISKNPVKAWTTLPPDCILVHPGPNRSVAIAWRCPADGTYKLRGLVRDAHPVGGGHAVNMQVDHIRSAQFGKTLTQLGALTKELAGPAPVPPDQQVDVAYAVREHKPQDVALHQRGDPELPGDVIPRRWLSVFGGEGVAGDEGSGRRQLATWVTENPLFARVLANRVWHWHFGRGIVATPNDFGFRGEAPAHPELLDQLAAYLVSKDYRLKDLHRLILNTKAWQRSSVAPAESAEKDPENALLSWYSRRRLTAEEIRDSLLVAGGNLDSTPGKEHPFPEPKTWGFTQHAPFNAVYETKRRSAYLMVQRQRRHPFLALFDGADPNSSTAIRDSTTVPTQALYFLNDPFFHEQANSLTEHVSDDESLVATWQRVSTTFRRVLQRSPTEEEQQLAQQFVDTYPGTAQEKWAAWARILMASNEFLYVD